MIGHFFLAKSFFLIQTFLDHTLFGQNLFFWTKSSFGPKFFGPIFFGKKFFFGHKMFLTHRIFWKQNILYQKFAGHKTSPSRPSPVRLDPATHSRLTHIYIFLYTLDISSKSVQTLGSPTRPCHPL